MLCQHIQANHCHPSTSIIISMPLKQAIPIQSMSLIPLFRFFVGLGIIFKKIRVIGYSKFKIIIIIYFSRQYGTIWW